MPDPGDFISFGWWCTDEEIFVSSNQYDTVVMNYCANCNSQNGFRAKVVAE